MSGMKLTNGETKLLAAVFFEMGQIPKLRYEEVAIMAGIKFARNTRASLKRLFSKVKAAAGEEFVDGAEYGPSKPGAAGKDEDDDEEEEEDDDDKLMAAPPKKQKKGVAIKKAAPRKLIGVPKKATASRGKTTSRKAKMPVTEVSDGEDVKEESNDGKFITLTFIPNFPEEDLCHASKSENEAPESGNGVNTAHRSEEEDAAFRGMTVEEWRAWKIEHNYDAYHSHYPTPILLPQ